MIIKLCGLLSVQIILRIQAFYRHEAAVKIASRQIFMIINQACLKLKIMFFYNVK